MVWWKSTLLTPIHDNKMKIRNTRKEYMNGIILTSDIHIVSCCEADGSLKNATYFITTSIDIN